jgi:hypothetical protein
VVARGEPFQFTTESLVKVVPLAAFTASVKLLGLLQNGADEGEMDPICGTGPGVELIVKRTMLETSVVVVTFVLFGLDVGDTAEPGMSIATCTLPAAVRSEAGTTAVSCTGLTKVVVSPVPFHRMKAPETKPVPLAVMVKPCEPAVAVLGLTNANVEEEV